MSTTLTPEFISIFQDAILEVSGKKLTVSRAEQPISELGLDSVAVMEMVGVLEEKLHVHFGDDDLAKIDTFGDLVSLLTRYRADKDLKKAG